MKHAPGPWKAWQRDSDKGTNYWLIRTANDATGLSDTLRGYCGESNARLIAAAPELLEALKDLLLRVAEPIEYGPDHAVTKARASIAKAESQS